MNVGERINFFRTQKNITVNKLALQAGISQSFLRDIELGNKKPSVETLSYICEKRNAQKNLFEEHYYLLADQKVRSILPMLYLAFPRFRNYALCNS